MKIYFIIYIAISIFIGCSQNVIKESKVMEYKKLTPEEERVIKYKGTEAPYTGKFYDFYQKGTYICKQCGAPLYTSSSKFESGCGWPSFDDEISGAVNRTLDADGRRTEITCARCGGHLGHVFEGEQFTDKNIRHCVNSISLEFIPEDSSRIFKNHTAFFAGGCFWGMEYFFQKEKGVISTDVGYMGGTINAPTYEEVCRHNTGYAEVVRVVYNPQQTNFETLARLFFEIHDPTQVDRQGPDVGDQYRSEIFYVSEEQKNISEKLKQLLIDKGLPIATKVTPAPTFWIAEHYHQNYYLNNGNRPYCHAYKKRF